MSTQLDREIDKDLERQVKVKGKKSGEIETLTDSGEEQRKADEWSPLGKVSSTTSDNTT